MNLDKVKETFSISVYEINGSNKNEIQGSIIAIIPHYEGHRNYAVIEWDGFFKDDGSYVQPFREGKYFDTIHETGWRDSDGRGLGVFFDRGDRYSDDDLFNPHI